MFLLVKILGIAMLVEGIIFLLNPKTVKKLASFWMQGKRVMIGAILSLLFGIGFLSIASQCKIPLVLTILGIISLAKGIFLLSLGPDKAKAKISWWTERPDGVMRLIAILAIAMGVLLLRSI